MRRFTVVCLAAVAGSFAVTPVLAQTTSAPAGSAASAAPVQPEPPRYHISSFRNLADLCIKPDTDPNYTSAISLCAGYISGVLDYHRLDTVSRSGRVRRVCVPTPAPSRAEALETFKAWYPANERYADEPAASGVMRFLMASYPCGKRSS